MRCSTDDGHRLIDVSTTTSVELTDWQETGDGEERWLRCQVDVGSAVAGERRTLVFDGIATVADVFVDDVLVLQSRSMFVRQSVELSHDVAGVVEIAVHCRPLPDEARKPRARWRTKLAASHLRFFRTMLLGRTPGIAPEAPVVGLWRPVRFERSCGVSVRSLRVRSQLDGDVGVVSVEGELPLLNGAVTGEVRVGDGAPVPLAFVGDRFSCEVRVEGPERWWPHTHGASFTFPVSIAVNVEDAPVEIDAGRVGFRTLTFLDDPERPQLVVNDVPVFVRGAVWTPTDADLRERLERVRDAGTNMLRVVGTAAYEAPEFYDLCDELGILVWQDFMFANFDYPIEDAEFRALVHQEAEQVVGALAHRPCLAVFCGNSEVEQQVAMLGLDPALARGELFVELLPGVIAGADCDADYLPSAPTGGALPFRTSAGVANYFGVGGYRRPLSDVRLADVRFASECLAISNVPNESVAPELGVPRDAGSDWDFADVRDHYLAELYGVVPDDVRRNDPDRYLALSREVSGELMAAVFGEWRRARSACSGGLMLWLADLEPGSGWGALDHAGRPKVAYHHLRRINAPVAVWLTDEGMNGLAVHAANDTDRVVEATLRLTVYRDGEHVVEEASTPLVLAPRSVSEYDAEALLGRFIDISWAYRFGSAEHDVVVASLDLPDRAPAVFFPAGRPLPAEGLGLTADHVVHDGRPAVRLCSTRFVWGLRLHIPGYAPSDDAFCLEPGRERLVWLEGEGPLAGEVTALNLQGRVPVT